MATFLAAAGRFTMEWLKTTAVALAGPQPAGATAGAWGVAYCYGNRLEAIRSNRSWQHDPDFALLSELKSDMAMLFLDSPGRQLGPREVQPFIRHEPGQTWAFCHLGTIANPDQLDPGPRLPDSTSPSEKYFLHILAGFNPGDPTGSVATLQAQLTGGDLAFCLMTPSLMVASSGTSPIWLGQSETLRVLSSAKLASLTLNFTLTPLAAAEVIAITRERREI